MASGCIQEAPSEWAAVLAPRLPLRALPKSGSTSSGGYYRAPSGPLVSRPLFPDLAPSLTADVVAKLSSESDADLSVAGRLFPSDAESSCSDTSDAGQKWEEHDMRRLSMHVTREEAFMDRRMGARRRSMDVGETGGAVDFDPSESRLRLKQAAMQVVQAQQLLSAKEDMQARIRSAMANRAAKRCSQDLCPRADVAALSAKSALSAVRGPMTNASTRMPAGLRSGPLQPTYSFGDDRGWSGPMPIIKEMQKAEMAGFESRSSNSSPFASRKTSPDKGGETGKPERKGEKPRRENNMAKMLSWFKTNKRVTV